MKALVLPSRARLALLASLAWLASWSIAGVQIAAAAVALAFVLTGGVRFVPVRASVLALAAWCLLSVLLSPAQLGSFLPTAWLPVLLVWIAASLAAGLPDPELERVGQAWVLATAVTSAWAVIQSYTGLDLLHLLHLRGTAVDGPSPEWPSHWATTGFFTSRLTYAHALLVPFGIACASALRSAGRARLLAIAATVLMGAGLVLSFARAAWWGALTVAAILVLATRARRAALLGAAAALAITAAVPRI